MNAALSPRPATLDCDLKEIGSWWVRNGIKPGTAAVYLWWIQRFRKYCRKRQLREWRQLTLHGARQFAAWYSRRRRIRRSLAWASARSALQAWANALIALGVSVPPWKVFRPAPAPRVPIIREFIDYRRQHGGVSLRTLQLDQGTSLEFVGFLRLRHRTYRTARLLDVDAFVAKLRRRIGVATLARQLCSVRALLRFLYVSKRLRFDLAASVVGPLLKPDRHPPRALPWPNVRRILQAVECSSPTSCRDYAILLLMSLYGLGGAEVIGLRLEDINWERKTIRICRPKTQSAILLPLLPAAARALVRYFQRGRPASTDHRHVFLRALMPYKPFSGSTAIRHMLTKYGRRAGVTTGSLGSHVLRHSQATRQVELGTPFKVVGDILGHRHPQATSHYTRSAVGRLRDLPLPLPHG